MLENSAENVNGYFLITILKICSQGKNSKLRKNVTKWKNFTDFANISILLQFSTNITPLKRIQSLPLCQQIERI